jgi:hemerythrin-like domain-containing protein
MVNPASILTQEHQAVLLKLEALENIIRNLAQPVKVSAQLKELAAFFDTQFWVHFDKEERALFPEFDNFMPRGAGPLAVMLDEHEVIRNTWEQVHEGVAAYLIDAGDAEAVHTIEEKGSHFIGFLRSHISKEDGLLFAMAEMHLNEGQKEKVVKLFSEIEKRSSPV